MRTHVKIVLLLIVMLLAPTRTLQAQTAFLDLNFGTGGSLMTPIPEQVACADINPLIAYDAALDTDGNLILVGEARNRRNPIDPCADHVFYITRLLPDGTLDLTFGMDGAASRNVSPLDFFLVAGIQTTSRIIATGGQSMVVNGRAVFNIALTGYTESGIVDSTFGGQGHIVLNLANWTGDPSSTQLPRDLVVDSSDRILIVGRVSDSEQDGQFFLLRFLPDGTLDSSFGDGGVVLTNFAAGFDEAHSLVLLPDGKLVAAGYFATSNAVPDGIALARYLPDGALDTSFGSAGRVIAPLGAINVAEALVVQPDGKLVVAGNANPALGLGSGFALVRFLSDGSVDTSFGTNGVVVLDVTEEPYTDLHLQYATVSDLVQLPDGRLVVGGTASYDGTERSDSDFAVARFSADGEVDIGFGTNGLVLTDFPPPPGTSASDNLYALAVQPDGKVVAVGDKFKVARYRTDTSVAREEALHPRPVATLHAPFPNPLRSETTLRYTLVRPGPVTLNVYDVLGREVATLAEGTHPSGTHNVRLGTESLPAGVYFVRLVADGKVHTHAITRLP